MVSMAKKTKGKKSGAATAAVALLTETNTPFQMREYEHVEGVTSFGEEAAKNLGVSEEQVFKTLLIVHEKDFAVAIVPVSGKLNIKAAAAALGWKSASMCDPKVAERRTGYVVGGISPLGQKTPPQPCSMSLRSFLTQSWSLAVSAAWTLSSPRTTC